MAALVAFAAQAQDRADRQELTDPDSFTMILLGDPQQIDHPLLDERTNGLSYAAEKMKGSPLCWQVTMSAEECERSALAMDAVKRM